MTDLHLLDAEGCDKLTDKSFDYLLRLKRLRAISMKNCDKITRGGIDNYSRATNDSIDIDGRNFFKQKDFFTQQQKFIERRRGV